MIKNGFVGTIARVCLVVLFPFSAADKVLNWSEAIKQARKGPMPEAAPVLMTAAIATEALAPIAIVAGRRDREAAALLAGFCTATALLYHPFWQHDDLFDKGKSTGREELWEFLKNFGLVGGLLFVACGQRPTKRRRRG